MSRRSALLRAMVVGQSLLIAGIVLIAIGLIARSMPGARAWLLVSVGAGIAVASVASVRLPIWGAWLGGTAASAASTLFLYALVPRIDLAAGLAGAPAHAIIGAWLAWAHRTFVDGAVD